MKYTVRDIRSRKGQEKIVCLTAADCMVARLLDAAGMDLILVGDSLGMTVLGYETTLPVTMEQMLHHTAAVVRGVKQAVVIADMPFMSYQVSRAQALENAGRFLQEAGADGVKLEGGQLRAPTIALLVENGIPVLGHIGLTPQSVQALGGYRVQGRGKEDAARLLHDARALEDAGVFALVLECVPAALGAEITAAVGVPVIGIGAGPECDGQILVTSDMLGMEDKPAPRFVKQYADVATSMAHAYAAYRADVQGGAFPDPDTSFA